MPQISAHISKDLKEELERYTDAHGVKKDALIERALAHHLQALRELPSDVIIPPRVILSRVSFEKVVDRILKPRKPTKAMSKLMTREVPRLATNSLDQHRIEIHAHSSTTLPDWPDFIASNAA